MMTCSVDFESFETDKAEPTQTLEFKRGHEAGVLAAKQDAETAAAAALSEIATTLSDMSFGFAEAKVHLIDLLRPLLEQVAQAALPMILHETFAARLVETVQNEFDSAASNPVEISVAPHVIEALQSGLPQGTLQQFQFRADSQMLDGQAVIRQGQAHVMLDLTALSNTLQQALSGLETLERNSVNAG